MRNAGDGTPGGSTGRRQRVPAPAGAARPAGNGGASLFTPAYRVRHSDGGGASEAAYGPGTTAQQTGGHRWPELDQPSASYRQADYGSGQPAYSWADDDLQSSGYSWLSDDHGTGSGWPSYSGDSSPRVSNAIRGLPPAPGDSLPSYPPGPFAAWNRGTSERGDGRGAASAAAALLEPPRRTRPATGEDSARVFTSATITPDEFDTNHSMPAIKDPVATKGRAAATSARPAAAPARNRSAAPARSRAAAQPRGRAQADRRGRRSKPASKRSRRQPVRLAIGVAAVIIVAVAAILVVTSIGKQGSNSAANGKTNRPRSSASPTPTPPPGKWGYIGARATDPVPLTLRELYPFNFAVGSVFYHAAASKEGHSCATALIGAALQTAVRHAHCSQVLRASYVARSAKVMATIGVFNLATSSAASTAALQAGPAEFVAELPSKIGPASSIGQGSGLEEAVVKGHYLVLVWAENIDLAAPSTHWQRQHLTKFMNTLVRQTINKSLSIRMVDGSPTSAPPPSGQGQ